VRNRCSTEGTASLQRDQRDHLARWCPPRTNNEEHGHAEAGDHRLREGGRDRRFAGTSFSCKHPPQFVFWLQWRLCNNNSDLKLKLKHGADLLLFTVSRSRLLTLPAHSRKRGSSPEVRWVRVRLAEFKTACHVGEGLSGERVYCRRLNGADFFRSRFDAIRTLVKRACESCTKWNRIIEQPIRRCWINPGFNLVLLIWTWIQADPSGRQIHTAMRAHFFCRSAHGRNRPQDD
jgi:hypothetical protein